MKLNEIKIKAQFKKNTNNDKEGRQILAVSGCLVMIF
jgi:hypothetical protein